MLRMFPYDMVLKTSLLFSLKYKCKSRNDKTCFYISYLNCAIPVCFFLLQSLFFIMWLCEVKYKDNDKLNTLTLVKYKRFTLYFSCLAWLRQFFLLREFYFCSSKLFQKHSQKNFPFFKWYLFMLFPTTKTYNDYFKLINPSDFQIVVNIFYFEE